MWSIDPDWQDLPAKILDAAAREDREAANSPRHSFALAYSSESEGRENTDAR
jgi:hypothetical protein